MAIVARSATVQEINDTGLNGTLTGVLPTGIQYGDILICAYAGSGTPANHTGPAGWTTLVTPTSIPDSALIAAYWIAHTQAAPVVSAPSVSYVNSARHSIMVQAYSGVNLSTPFDVTPTIATAAATTTVSAPSVTTVTANAMLVSGALLDSATGLLTKPSSMTLAADTSGGGTGRGGAIAEETKATAGSTGVRTWTGSAAFGMGAWLTALRPGTVATFTGSCTASGSVRRGFSKTFSGSSTAVGTWSYIKVVERIFTASITAAGSITKLPRKFLAGSTTSVGALRKLIPKSLAGSVAASGSFSKSMIRVFAGSITAVSTISLANIGRVAGKVGVAALRVVRTAEAYLRRRVF